MDVFEFYKTIRLKKAKKYFSQLEKLYSKIPDTKGCLENINKEKGCGGWCCFHQSPQLLYVEFLYSWNEIFNNWDLEEIADVIELAMINYVLGFTTKGCIFFDKSTKMCRIHKFRPYNCRIYAITPKEEFQPRYERMKEIYKGVLGAVIRNQCDLVSTIDNKPISTKDTDRWWEKLIDIEQKLGISKNNINDDTGGSYRTFHDHLLLYLTSDDIMDKLQGIRLSDNIEEKLMAVHTFMQYVKKKLKK